MVMSESLRGPHAGAPQQLVRERTQTYLSTSLVCSCVVTFSLLNVCGPIMFLSVAFCALCGLALKSPIVYVGPCV